MVTFGRIFIYLLPPSSGSGFISPLDTFDVAYRYRTYRVEAEAEIHFGGNIDLIASLPTILNTCNRYIRYSPIHSIRRAAAGGARDAPAYLRGQFAALLSLIGSNNMNNLKRTSSHNNNNSSNHNIIHPTSPDSSLALIRSADIYQNSISEQRPNESLLDYWTRRENEVAQRAQRQSYLEQRSMRKMKKNGSSAGQPRNQLRFHEDAAAAAAAVVATTTDSTNTNSNSNSQLSLSYSNCQEAGTGITITSSHNVQFRDLEEDAYSSFDDDDDDDDLKIKDIIERDLESPHWVKKEDKQLLNEGAGVVPVDSLIFTGSGEGLNDVMMSQFSSEDPSDTDLDAWQKEGGTSAPNLHVDLEKCSWSLLEEHLVYLSKRTDLILPSLLQIDHSHGNATPLHTACWKAPPPLALHMISLLPRIYQHMEHVCVALDTDGNTALHLCAANICQDFQNQKRSSQSAYCTEKNSDIYRHVQYKEEEEEEVIGDQYCNIPGFRGEDVLEALVLSAPRALTIQNKEGDTPLHLAVSSSFSTPHAVSLLTDGTSRACFLQDCTGATPLHAAIANNVDERVLSVLLDAAPDTAQIPDNQGLLPLHYVAAFSHTPIAFVRNLIKIYPHAISAQTVDGDTPLHLAISNCKSEDELTISTVQLLLGNHDVNDRRSPLFIENNEKVRKCITPYYCHVFPLK
jgi:ankyrin repeat protein